MASACVNKMVGVPPENFRTMGWLSPRISFTRPAPADKNPDSSPNPDPESCPSPLGDFEFRLDNPVGGMLPADELFSDGKLVPLLHFPKPPTTTNKTSTSDDPPTQPCRRSCDVGPISNSTTNIIDPYLLSPKAPRCSSRWRELLGLKKDAKTTPSSSKTSPSSTLGPAATGKSSSIRSLLHRNSKTTASDSSLLLESDSSSSLSTSSRMSLSSSSSSSSSGHDHDDLPRLSLDADKPSRESSSFRSSTRPRVRPVRPRIDNGPSRVRRAGAAAQQETMTTTGAGRGVSVDSPRMNPSGKVVFQGLERSSSSPSSFNGGPRYKHRGMERSYSANVRVTPVLNVGVCSLRGSSKSGVFGFGQLFSGSSSSSQNGQRREKDGSSNGGSGSGSGRIHRRKERQLIRV